MAVDVLQEKIRKAKNPSMLELSLNPSELPPHLLAGKSEAQAYGQLCSELLEQMKGIIPAARVSFSSFSLLGGEGLSVMQTILNLAKNLGYYVVLEAPEVLSPKSAILTAERLMGEHSVFSCDGILISGYLGSDVIKPFLPYCKSGKKDLFVVVRTANKSASEIQDLLAGSRLVHAAAADHVNRYGADTLGKSGYTRVGILAAASSAESLRSLRTKYPKLFFLLDGYDYPNANAKNCSNAFDRFGHGAVVSSSGIATAWQGESDGTDYLVHAKAAAERMKKNLTRYITVL